MNIKDFLELRTKYFDKESLKILIFASLFTFLVAFGLEALFIKLSINDFFIQDYKTLLIFEYPALVVMFLGFYKVGIIISSMKVGIPRFKKIDLFYDFAQLNSIDLLKIFDHQGMLSNFFEKEKCLYLNSSSEGLITKYRFKKYKMAFDTKILYHGFGVIIRAKDLENYFMYRVNFDNSGISITPHIRKDGVWEIQTLYLEGQNKAEVNEGEVLKFEIINEEFTSSLKIIKGNKAIKKFEYIFPKYFPLLPEVKSDSPTPKNIVSKIDWPKSGCVGFRAHGVDERAIIYNLKVKELQ